MATRLWFPRADPARKAEDHSGRQAFGLCCVFVAGSYVAAIVVLVGYLIVLSFG
jgi:hypothetical protein